MNRLTLKINNLKEKIQNTKITIKQIHSKAENLGIEQESIKDKLAKILNQSKADQIVKFNVRGMKFNLSQRLIFNRKDTLLYSIVNNSQFDINEELMFDRSPIIFKYILQYYRYNNIDYRSLNPIECNCLLEEAIYFEIDDISEYLSERAKGPYFIKYEYTNPFLDSDDNLYVKDCQISDFDNKSLKQGGCCVDKKGYVIFELNTDWKIHALSIGPYVHIVKGSGWLVSYGSGAKILTSMDKNLWNEVGEIPNTYSTKILKIELAESLCKYIKIQHPTGPLGLSHLKPILKEDEIINKNI